MCGHIICGYLESAKLEAKNPDSDYWRAKLEILTFSSFIDLILLIPGLGPGVD